MPQLRVELQLPPSFWLTRLSQGFSETSFWVVALQRHRSGIAVALLSGSGWPPGAVTSFLEKHPDVVRVRALERSRSTTMLRVRYRRPVLVPILEEIGLLPRFPFAVRSGVAYWEILGVERASHGMIRVLEHRLPGSRVRSISSTPTFPSRTQFTPRQERAFERALALGYYDFPRRITLTDLAETLGVDKGSLSVMLVRIEALLADHWRSTASLPRPWVPMAPRRRRSRGRAPR
ncbi:MAG: helix-turn-helix domain-containing protein [Euryarchaeota archaeon]|nr:helix-turn-helix domain-containing protein [Euryarchaeota archaeon]MDE1837823.1 helix-turn-helix domain-containing protein [Euryarchaeota archaeon]MDE1880097.1 helix-turn-helix domain-containing protein [Euryarchaeota archaeon]MDE2045065.1 helix-turn-helix domain-containing protein [Thermoplasmata archaeon]